MTLRHMSPIDEMGVSGAINSPETFIGRHEPLTHAPYPTHAIVMFTLEIIISNHLRSVY